MVNRITLPDGRRVKDRWVKRLRPIAYFLMGLAGLLLYVSPAILEALGGVVALVMAGFLVVGGFASLYGVLSDKWMGEFIGLPLLIASFSVFAIIETAAQLAAAPWAATANLCLLLAVAALLASRWREVYAIFRLAERHAPGRKGE